MHNYGERRKANKWRNCPLYKWRPSISTVAMLMLSIFLSLSPVGFLRSGAHRLSNGEIKYIVTTRIRRVRREATKDKARRPLTVKNCCWCCLRLMLSLDRIAREDVQGWRKVGKCQDTYSFSEWVCRALESADGCQPMARRSAVAARQDTQSDTFNLQINVSIVWVYVQSVVLVYDTLNCSIQLSQFELYLR